MDDRGVRVRVSVEWKIVFKSSRPALGPSQAPIQCVPGALSPDLKRPGRTSGEVKKCGSIHPLSHTPSWRTFIYLSTGTILFSLRLLIRFVLKLEGARGSVVGWWTMLQAGRSRDRVPTRSLEFLPNPSSRTMALGSTRPLKEMSTRNLPGSKALPARKGDNLTAICEPTV
jgi:hypothetical protein